MSTWDPQNWNWQSDQVCAVPNYVEQEHQAKKQKQTGLEHLYARPPSDQNSFPIPPPNQHCNFLHPPLQDMHTSQIVDSSPQITGHRLQIVNHRSQFLDHRSHNVDHEPQVIGSCEALQNNTQSSDSLLNDISNSSLEDLLKNLSPPHTTQFKGGEEWGGESMSGHCMSGHQNFLTHSNGSMQNSQKQQQAHCTQAQQYGQQQQDYSQKQWQQQQQQQQQLQQQQQQQQQYQKQAPQCEIQQQNVRGKQGRDFQKQQNLGSHCQSNLGTAQTQLRSAQQDVDRQVEYSDDEDSVIDINSLSESVCRVPGCGRSLKSLKEYNIKYRICDVHIKLPQVLIRGRLQRFCQQCSRFHELSAFDGNRRSCRVQLNKHNERRRKYRQKDQGTALNDQVMEVENSGHQSSIKGLVQQLIENPQDLQALRVLLGVQPQLFQPTFQQHQQPQQQLEHYKQDQLIQPDQLTSTKQRSRKEKQVVPSHEPMGNLGVETKNKSARVTTPNTNNSPSTLTTTTDTTISTAAVATKTDMHDMKGVSGNNIEDQILQGDQMTSQLKQIQNDKVQKSQYNVLEDHGPSSQLDQNVQQKVQSLEEDQDDKKFQIRDKFYTRDKFEECQKSVGWDMPQKQDRFQIKEKVQMQEKFRQQEITQNQSELQNPKSDDGEPSERGLKQSRQFDKNIKQIYDQNQEKDLKKNSNQNLQALQSNQGMVQDKLWENKAQQAGSDVQGGMSGKRQMKELYGQINQKYEYQQPGKSIELAQEMLQIDQLDYQSDECFITISMKLFGKTPADLPTNLKDMFINWLGSIPKGIVSYIKPGCVLLVVDFKVARNIKAYFKKMGALLFFSKFNKDMNCLLKCGTSLVQFEEEVALINDGKLKNIWSNDLAEYISNKVSPISIRLAPIKQISPQSIYLKVQPINQNTPSQSSNTLQSHPSQSSLSSVQQQPQSQQIQQQQQQQFQQQQQLSLLQSCCNPTTFETSRIDDGQNDNLTPNSKGLKRVRHTFTQQGQYECKQGQVRGSLSSGKYITVGVDMESSSNSQQVQFRCMGRYLQNERVISNSSNEDRRDSVQYKVDISQIVSPSIIQVESLKGCFLSKPQYFLISNNSSFSQDLNTVSKILNQRKIGHILNDLVVDIHTYLAQVQTLAHRMKYIRLRIRRGEGEGMSQKRQDLVKNFYLENFGVLQKIAPVAARIINVLCDCGCHNSVLQMLNFMVKVSHMPGGKIISLLRGQVKGEVSLLHRAVRSINPILLRKLHEWGVRNNFEFKVDSHGPFGITPLHLSMMLPSEQEQAVIEITAILLNLWSSMNTQKTKLTTAQVSADDGVTPYQMALQMGTCRLDEILKALVDCIGQDCEEKLHYHELNPCICHSSQFPTVVSVIPQCAFCVNIPLPRQICNGIVPLSQKNNKGRTYPDLLKNKQGAKTNRVQELTAEAVDEGGAQTWTRSSTRDQGSKINGNGQGIQEGRKKQEVDGRREIEKRGKQEGMFMGALNFMCADHRREQVGSLRGEYSQKYRRVFHVDTLCADCFSGNHLIVAV